MPPVKKPAKPGKPNEPKKPSSRSKTKNAECSQAASTWQLSLRGKATATAETYQTLAKCRALASSQRKADAYGRTGKLSEQGKTALESRLQSRFESGLITDKSRKAKLADLLAKRKAAIDSGKSAATSDETVSRINSRAQIPANDKLLSGYRWRKDGTLEVQKGPYQASIADEITGSIHEMQQRQKARKTFKSALQNIPKTDSGYAAAAKHIKSEIEQIPFKNIAERAKIETLEKLKVNFAETLSTKTIQGRKPEVLESVARSMKQPAPNPPKYSLGGQLAPGRGTEERKDVADKLKLVRRIAKTSMQVAEHLRPTRYVDKYGSSGIMIPEPFDANQARKNVYSRMNLTRDYEQARRKARTLTRKANKLAR